MLNLSSQSLDHAAKYLGHVEALMNHLKVEIAAFNILTSSANF